MASAAQAYRQRLWRTGPRLKRTRFRKDDETGEGVDRALREAPGDGLNFQVETSIERTSEILDRACLRRIAKVGTRRLVSDVENLEQQADVLDRKSVV